VFEHRVVPWKPLKAMIQPHASSGRPAVTFLVLTSLHQQWFGMLDPAMEEALYYPFMERLNDA